MTYTKNVVIGGGNAATGYPNGSFLVQDKDFSLGIASSIKSITTNGNDWQKKGILKCAAYDINGSYKEVLTLGAKELNLFDGYHKITRTNSYFNGEVRCQYIGPMLDATGAVLATNIGNPTDRFSEMWVDVGGYKTSDKRLKENITPLEYGLSTVLQLKPFTYVLKSEINGSDHHGFIAQDLQIIFPNSIVAGSETDSSCLGVEYTEFVPILTLAIQQQQSIIDSLKYRLDLVFASNIIKDNSKVTSYKITLNQLPLLFQNHPNPFNGFTFIDYYLLDNIANAFLKVIDNTGKLIKAFPLNKTGFGQVELDCSNLAIGTYHYSLLVDSSLIDTKTMIIAATD